MASQPPEEAVPLTGEEVALYKQLDEYNWDADSEFQGGLQAILGSAADQTRAEHLALRARCFYFSRKNNVRIDFNHYISWRASQTATPAVNGMASCPSDLSRVQSVERRASVAQPDDNAQHPSEPPAPYPTSFEQIVELISTGQPITGIKYVPDTVLEGQASQASAARRKKPWEKANETPVEPDSSEGVALNA